MAVGIDQEGYKSDHDHNLRIRVYLCSSSRIDSYVDIL